jgi:hypothetical protein
VFGCGTKWLSDEHGSDDDSVIAGILDNEEMGVPVES